MASKPKEKERPAMINKTYKTLETPSGSGELRVAGAHLAKVFYHLQVRQEIVGGEAADMARGLDISGEVTVSQDEPMQTQVLRRVGSGERLTLHLADGRRLDVYATKGEGFSDAFRIVPAESTGFISEQPV
jgi:hypothetical protein